MWENGNDPSWDWWVCMTIHRKTFQSLFFSLLCTLFRERERERVPTNCLSPLPDKTATANNAWDLVNQTTLPFLFSLSSAKSHQLSEFQLYSVYLQAHLSNFHPSFLTTSLSVSIFFTFVLTQSSPLSKPYF